MSQMGSNFPSSSPGDSFYSEPAPNWPKTVGIISIVWASLGLVCNGCNGVGGLFATAMSGMIPPEQRATFDAQFKGVTPLLVTTYFLMFALGVLLLFAGIWTLRRRPSGRMLHLAYGAVGIVFTAIKLFAVLPMIEQKIAAMQGGAVDPSRAAGMKVGGYVGGSCVVLFSLVYPVFCLIWFGAKGKRPEEGATPQEPLV